MIDLHCHMLPGIDDGAPDLDTALAMARCAAADGITTTACTPHIYPGLYENEAAGIAAAVEALRGTLAEAGIELQLTVGADIQIVPELLSGLRRGTHPTLGGSRYFLFEPPHHTVPTRFHEILFDVVAAGYVPVITHPERLTWLDDTHYPWFQRAAREGAWIQLTSGALTGRFGRRAQYWSERMLDDGMVHILATDSHDPVHRPPSSQRAARPPRPGSATPRPSAWSASARARFWMTSTPPRYRRRRCSTRPASRPSTRPRTHTGTRTSKGARNGRNKGWLASLFS